MKVDAPERPENNRSLTANLAAVALIVAPLSPCKQRKSLFFSSLENLQMVPLLIALLVMNMKCEMNNLTFKKV